MSMSVKSIGADASGSLGVVTFFWNLIFWTNVARSVSFKLDHAGHWGSDSRRRDPVIAMAARDA
eukprot:SAG31_NODE_10652_length_1113_cov_2.232742_2_plen_64_part_00